MSGAFDPASSESGAESSAPEAWVHRVWFRFVDDDETEADERAAAPRESDERVT